MALEYYADPDGIWSTHTDVKTSNDYSTNSATLKCLWESPLNQWIVARDQVTGRHYYFNLGTGESRWSRPFDAEVVGDPNDEDPFDYHYDGSDGQGPGLGFVPVYNPDRQRAFWHSAAKGVIAESKPAECKHPFSESPDWEDLDAAIDEEARKLVARVTKARTANEHLRHQQTQLQRTCEQRLEQLRMLGQSRKLRHVANTQGAATKMTGRHMEGNFEVGVVPTTTSKTMLGSTAKGVIPALTSSFLRSVPLFHSLEETQFNLLLQNIQVQHFTNGQVIVRQDTPGDLFYLVFHGVVRIYEHPSAGADERRRGSYNPVDSAATSTNSTSDGLRRASNNPQTAAQTDDLEDEDQKKYGLIVNEIKSGDYFGERALLNGTLRSATAIAVGEVTCLALDREIFSSVVSRDLIIEGETIASHSNEEVASLARHIKNYEALLIMKARGRSPTEKKVADALLALVGAFSPELAVNDTIERMLKTLYAVFEVERISLFFVDWKTEELILQVSKDSEIREVRLPMGAGLVGACARSGKIVNVPDVTKDPRFFGDMDKKSGFTTRCVLCCPIMDGNDRATAVIQLVNKKGNQSIFSKDDEEVLSNVAEQMALTLAHKQVEMQSDGSKKNTPLWQVEDLLHVVVKRFYNNSLSKSGRGPLGPAGAGGNSAQQGDAPVIVVEVSVYHAGVALCPTVKTAVKAQSTVPVLSATFMSEQELGIKICNLPRAARIIFNISFAAVDDKGVPFQGNIPGEAIGWAGATLFNFDQILRAGHVRLKLFPGRCTSDLAGVATLLSNSTKKDTDILDIEIPRFAKPIVYLDNPNMFRVDATRAAPGPRANGEMSHVVKLMIEELRTFINKDPLYKLKDDDKLIILQAREVLKTDPSSLPKYLQSVPWNSAKDIQEAYRILYQWEVPGPVDALTLLDHTTPDPKVRALAVSLLEGLTDEELVLYLLQLVQVLKFEPFLDSALARFLLRRALRSPKTVGQSFYWLLKGEMHVPEVRERFTTLLRLFQRHCGETQREAAGHQEYVLRRLQEVAVKVKTIPKAERNSKLRALLRSIVFPDFFNLPLNPALAFKGVNVEKCRVMSSKKVPLWLNFISATPNSPPLTVLFKQGDDLRQDQLTLQVLRVIDLLWKTEDLDLQMSCYGCISTGFEQGLIEVVPDSETIGSITAGKGVRLRKIRAIANVYDERRLKNWLKSKGYPPKVWEENFMRSAAGYSVATYVLGIGDRHNDNIMMTSSGRLFHIDFGHFLGHYKYKLGVKRERAPFIWTPAMAYVLGGADSKLYKEFEGLCSRAFNILRKHSNLLITLFTLCLQSGIPELESDSDVYFLRDRLLIGQTDDAAASHFVKVIREALTTRSVQVNDAIHLLVHA